MSPMRPPKTRTPTEAVSATFLLLLLALVIPSHLLAQQFKVLHTFHGPDGSFPTDVLIRDSTGYLYGTTEGGGNGGCGGYGCGTVFKMNGEGKESWLYSFRGTTEIDPSAGLLRDRAGNLYGTTIYGGKITKSCGGSEVGGCGTVYRVTKTGRGSVLYKFKGTPDGFWPESLLAGDSAGNIYGTTYEGGSNQSGTVFKLDTNGVETVLYNFSGSVDGCSPYPGVILDSVGNTYGAATDCGAYGYGVVFEVDSSGNETVLHSFSSGLDGANPGSVLLFDSKGNLYGTTAHGGNSECGGTGCGTVFELSPDGNRGWTERVLYAFCSVTGCTDGEEPITGPLVMDASGNIYGTTYFGGSYRNCNEDACGVVFKLAPDGNETVLHSFTGGSDGAFPVAGLVIDSSRKLYGTTQQGGASCFKTYTCGVVFRIVP